MNHLVTDVARAVVTERLREADHTRAGRRLTRKARSKRMRSMTQRSGPVLLAAAVFLLAFSSTATAAKLITGKQVKNGSVTSVDVRDGSMSGLEVADGSLTEADLAEVVQGPQGPPGDEGGVGDPGPSGAPGSSGLRYVVESRSVPKDSALTWSAFCPPETKVLGGGLSSASASLFWMQASGPDISGDSWVVTAHNRHNTALTAFAWAVCATAP
ncbi:MAG: collagen-like protein [Solirubrobacteraceae bacterium]|nr:collagen-like protein [Solirubrobacteraceae bacterium]